MSSTTYFSRIIFFQLRSTKNECMPEIKHLTLPKWSSFNYQSTNVLRDNYMTSGLVVSQAYN